MDMLIDLDFCRRAGIIITESSEAKDSFDVKHTGALAIEMLLIRVLFLLLTSPERPPNATLDDRGVCSEADDVFEPTRLGIVWGLL